VAEAGGRSLRIFDGQFAGADALAAEAR